MAAEQVTRDSVNQVNHTAPWVRNDSQPKHVHIPGKWHRRAQSRD